MIPKADDGLRSLVQRFLTQVLADTQSGYVASDGMVMGLLMNALADELGEGIARRLADIATMSALLREGQAFRACEVVDVPANLTLAGVNACHDGLTRDLILLHAAVETDGGPSAARLNRAIWQYLAETTERHTLKAVP